MDIAAMREEAAFKEGVTVAKPALKKHPLFNDESGNCTPNGDDATLKKKGHLKWDEEVIAEHDQLRGTRMKIDEPNTPFHYDSGAESDGSHAKSPSRKRTTIDFNLLQDRLSDVANNNGNGPTSPMSNYDAESEVDEEKKRQFLEYRKKHYNEMDLVRQFREKHPDDSFEDDDDQVTSLKVHNDIE